MLTGSLETMQKERAKWATAAWRSAQKEEPTEGESESVPVDQPEMLSFSESRERTRQTKSELRRRAEELEQAGVI